MCEHRDFSSKVEIEAIVDTGHWRAGITIYCKTCGVQFQIGDLPVGLELEKATVSPDRTKAYLPIFPYTGFQQPVPGSRSMPLPAKVVHPDVPEVRLNEDGTVLTEQEGSL